jgi:hypothetical protein
MLEGLDSPKGRVKIMGFFGSVGGFSEPKPAAPADTYLCKLVSVEQTERKKYQSEEKEPCLRWVWATTEVGDDEGTPFRFSRFTSVWYGNPQSKLTQLLDSMLGKRLSKVEYNALSIEELKSKPWKVTVSVAVTNAGAEVNNIEDVRPATATAPKKISKPINTDGITDPFAEATY